MPVTAVVGANWGDEGKGKIIDYLAENSNIVMRFQGGNNAGHTVINQFGKFALHLIPCGVFYSHTLNLLGPGVGVNLESLKQELNELKNQGISNPNVRISDRAQVVLPYHIELDKLEEARLGDKKFGSTQTGMAPFYSDKYLKTGIQIGELLDYRHLHTRLNHVIEQKNILLKHLYSAPQIEAEPLLDQMHSLGCEMSEMLVDSTTLLFEANKKDQTILIEGQLGALRDPDHGIYPFSTSSSTLSGYASVGAGLPPHSLTKVIATVKAYSSCVGAGPFTTELLGSEGNELREKGGDSGEYGATTGRARRVGWFDAVATRYGCRVQGATEIALTLLDVLGYLNEIPICTSYNYKSSKLKDFPRTSIVEKCHPIYENLPGWKSDISNIRLFSDLPIEAQNYVHYIEKEIEVPIKWISVGPKREQIIRI